MISSLKALLRYCQFRSRSFRLLSGFSSVALGRTRSLGVEHLLTFREEDSIGPLQREEALLLYALTRVLRPLTVVEFGFFQGHSAFNFLQALDRDAAIYSFDIAETSRERASRELNTDSRLKYLHKSQAEFTPADIDSRLADLVFFDGAHDFEINCETFRRLWPVLSEDAIIVIHDTGLWERSRFLPLHHNFVKEYAGEWISENLYAHQPDERRFVDWIRENHTEMHAIHLHSLRTLRHGMSILQKSRFLTQPR